MAAAKTRSGPFASASAACCRTTPSSGGASAGRCPCLSGKPSLNPETQAPYSCSGFKTRSLPLPPASPVLLRPRPGASNVCHYRHSSSYSVRSLPDISWSTVTFASFSNRPNWSSLPAPRWQRRNSLILQYIQKNNDDEDPSPVLPHEEKVENPKVSSRERPATLDLGQDRTA